MAEESVRQIKLRAKLTSILFIEHSVSMLFMAQKLISVPYQLGQSSFTDLFNILEFTDTHFWQD